MSLGHEHGLVLIGLAGPMDVVNLSLCNSRNCIHNPGTIITNFCEIRSICLHSVQSQLLNSRVALESKVQATDYEEEEIHYVHTASKGL